MAISFTDNRVIWLDDERNPLKGEWYKYICQFISGEFEIIWAKNYDDFITVTTLCLQNPKIKVIAIFFDNDIGVDKFEDGRIKEGRHAFNWLDQYIRENDIPFISLYAQTMNLAAKREMKAGFSALRSFWRRKQSERE